MTIDILNEQYKNLQLQIDQLKVKQKGLLQEALKFALYPIGTRFKYSHGHSSECIVTNINASWGYKDIDVNYSYAPIKKDGSIGFTAAHRVGEDIIRRNLITP